MDKKIHLSLLFSFFITSVMAVETKIIKIGDSEAKLFSKIGLADSTEIKGKSKFLRYKIGEDVLMNGLVTQNIYIGVRIDKNNEVSSLKFPDGRIKTQSGITGAAQVRPLFPQGKLSHFPRSLNIIWIPLNYDGIVKYEIQVEVLVDKKWNPYFSGYTHQNTIFLGEFIGANSARWKVRAISIEANGEVFPWTEWTTFEFIN